MAFRPVGTLVAVTLGEGETITSAGIHLVEKEKTTEPTRGKIVALGDQCELGFQKGDEIIFKPYSGSKAEIDGTEYLFIDEADIVGVWTK